MRVGLGKLAFLLLIAGAACLAWDFAGRPTFAQGNATGGAAKTAARKSPPVTKTAVAPPARPAASTAATRPAVASGAAPTTAAAPAAPPAPVTYEVRTPDLSLRQQTNQVMGILRSGFASDADRQVFDDYHRKYVFPAWTQEANRSQLGRWRSTLSSRLRLAAKDPHDRLNELIVEYMGKDLAGGNFHPVVRYNAMLMVGDLNALEPASLGSNPTPLAAAVPVMLDALDSPTQHAVVKVAALIGIERHLRLGGLQDADVRKRTAAVLSKLVAEGSPADAAGGDAQEWLRGRAASILAQMGSADSQPEVGPALVLLVNDSKASLNARSEAADALGRVGLQRGNAFDAAAAAKALAKFGLDSVTAEEGPVKSRRRLLSRLSAALVGLAGPEGNGGVMAAMPDDTGRQLGQSLVQTMRKMVDALNAIRDESPANLATSLGTLRSDLERLSGAEIAATATAR